jgi:SAM-dependent methyltransferase
MGLDVAGTIRWHDNAAGYFANVRSGFEGRRDAERALSIEPAVSARCEVCQSATVMRPDVGLRFGEAVDLRSGMVCAGCGLNQRQRLLFDAVLSAAPRSAYIAERLTPLYAGLATRVPPLVGSEYFGPDHDPGALVEFEGHTVRHEDLTRLSFASASFDVVAHGDILEHVPDYVAALREIRRVLRPGGSTIFTVPFLERLEDHEIRAVVDGDSVVHLMQPEIHGNPVGDGALVFQNFGWRLLHDLRAAGFDRAEIGVGNSLAHGYTSNNSPYGNYMEAVVFRGVVGERS